jgi:hypothetical protein
MSGSSRRRHIDPSAISALASRPGIDPRVWNTMATVTEVGYIPGQGVFVDVRIEPHGEPETAFVGIPYAGGGFGSWYPIEVGDLVLVAYPHGDSGYGPVVIARYWSGGDPPPAATDLDWAVKAAAEEPPADVVIRVKPGSHYKLRGAAGSNIDIALDLSANGDVIVENLGSGKVKLGLAETAVPVALSPLVEAAIKAAVDTAIANHAHATAGATGAPSGGIALVGAGVYSAIVASTAATKTEAT